MTTYRLNRARVVTATMAVAALALTAACAPGAGPTTAATSSSSSSAAAKVDDGRGQARSGDSDGVGPGGPRRPGRRDVALNKAFEKKYPNITIKRNAQSFDDLAKTLRLALSGPGRP